MLKPFFLINSINNYLTTKYYLIRLKQFKDIDDYYYHIIKMTMTIICLIIIKCNPPDFIINSCKTKIVSISNP